MVYQIGKTKGEEPSKSQQSLGEHEIIRKYISPLSHTQPLELDCEEDAAIIEFPAGKLVVITTDAIIEGTHFFSTDSPETVAKKALRVNLSDLAAMGAHPIGYTLCLSISSSVTEDWLSRFFHSLSEDNQAYRISLVGGDTNKTQGPTHISVTAFGDVAEGHTLSRKGAKTGDRIYVTGTIGDAALGLKVLQGEYPVLAEADRQYLTSRFHVPTPQHVLAQHLAEVINAATDISDGLLSDMETICNTSHLQAYLKLDKIPLSKAVRKLLKDADDAQRASIYQSICTGGDDYELLFTASPGESDHIDYLSQRYGVPITCIGHLGVKASEESGHLLLLDQHGQEISITQLGYEHRW